MSDSENDNENEPMLSQFVNEKATRVIFFNPYDSYHNMIDRMKIVQHLYEMGFKIVSNHEYCISFKREIKSEEEKIWFFPFNYDLSKAKKTFLKDPPYIFGQISHQPTNVDDLVKMNETIKDLTNDPRLLSSLYLDQIKLKNIDKLTLEDFEYYEKRQSDEHSRVEIGTDTIGEDESRFRIVLLDNPWKESIYMKCPKGKKRKVNGSAPTYPQGTTLRDLRKQGWKLY